MPTTSSETIRAKWRTKIWQHADILAVTTSILEQEITEVTHKEISRLRFATKINFFSFRVRRGIETLMAGKYRLRFFVDISYTKWADPDGANYNDVIDGIETVQDLVMSELGGTWDGLIASSEPQDGAPEVSVVTIGDEAAFKADFSYSGFICNI
jgi:hypothetical protein